MLFRNLLIANRGEIACRIIRTAQQMGLHCIAVYSDADANAPHVKMADEAYYLGASPARDSYLCGDKILAIAKKSKADAVHPGYGFLSENAEFAQQCAAANIIFVGPPASAITAMGSKSNAKQIMQTAKVPLVPGYHGKDQSLSVLQKEADKIGYPVLLKAVAGGGGKGMRVVNKANEFKAALEATQREALSSFGDDHVLIEKYLTKPRHVEIQVFSDQQDHHVYLFERDCSIQRRHQKIIEEAPAPGLSSELRRTMGETAIACAKAIGYVGAGTVEFLLDEDGQFYFMEMNTRLQVEHPVTEMITGLDLVAWQLRVAAGEPLPLTQKDITLQGHAIEARIYAEDPLQNFLPSIGTIRYLRQPMTTSELRIDTGIKQGCVISQYYDPMIAKLIIWGEDRAQAILRLQQALSQYHVVGVKTNLDLLSLIAKHPVYFSGNLTTHFIPQHEAELLTDAKAITDEAIICAAIYQALTQKLQLQKQAAVQGEANSPWYDGNQWRLNLPAEQRFHFIYHDVNYELHVQYEAQTLLCEIEHRHYRVQAELHDYHLHLKINDQQWQAQIVPDNHELYLFLGGERYVLQLPMPEWELEGDMQDNGHLRAPMPGTVTAVLVKPQQKVKQGDTLIVLEAMKMEHTICAPADGTVSEIGFCIGETVDEGAELIIMEHA